MKILEAPTEDYIKGERTALAAASLAGSSIQITVENTNGYTADDFVAVGHEGNEKSELAQIVSVDSDTQMTLASLNFAHVAGQPILQYLYNQRKFYGSTTQAGTFTELTSYGSPADIQIDDPIGTTLEYTGSEGFTFFKSTYYNSETSTETDIADANAVEADEGKRYTSIFLIRKKAGILDNPYLNNDYVEGKRKEAESGVNAYLAKRYTLPLAEVPKVIQNITTTLAAGYIHDDEFGEEGHGPDWIDRAHKMLREIASGKLELIDSSNAEMSNDVTTSESLKSYPDRTADNGRSGRIFSITDRW